MTGCFLFTFILVNCTLSKPNDVTAFEAKRNISPLSKISLYTSLANFNKCSLLLACSLIIHPSHSSNTDEQRANHRTKKKTANGFVSIWFAWGLKKQQQTFRERSKGLTNKGKDRCSYLSFSSIFIHFMFM